MTSLQLVQLAVVVMVALNLLMVALTFGVKAARAARNAWYARQRKPIELAIEAYLLSGENQPQLEALSPWRRDIFVSPLIVERLALVRGTGEEQLLQLAERLGLVERYLKDLGSWRRWRRARAAQYLGHFGGERSVAPLKRLLAEADETIRAVAVRALAHIGTPQAARTLVETLNTPSEITRLRIAENLERIGREAVAPLVVVLERAQGSKRDQLLLGAVQAAQVLGQLRAPEARVQLNHAALHGQSVDLRAKATLALGKIGDPDDLPTLLAAAGDKEWPVRAQAANALAMIGEAATITMLKHLTADPQWWVRFNASRALANMGPRGEQALLEVLEGDDLFARHRAAATLESRALTRQIVARLATVGKKGEHARRTVRALVKAGSTKHLHQLVRSLPDGENHRLLSAILEEMS